MESWIKEITEEDIPFDYRHLAKLIGIERLILLSNIAGGTRFYVPKTETLIQIARNKRIVQEFNGANHKELARKYNLSEDWIRKIIAQSKINRNQLSLFEQY